MGEGNNMEEECKRTEERTDRTIEDSIEVLKNRIVEEITVNLSKHRKVIFEELNSYREKLNVTIVNPIFFARYFDIDVKKTDLGQTEGLKGFYAMDKKKNNLIFVHEKENNVSKRNIIAHEIAHCLLVPKDLLPENLPGNIVFDKYCTEHEGEKEENDQIELLCDEFARDLLMPEDEFRNIFDRDFYGRDRIGIAADYFKVEYRLAKKRAEELKLL